MALDGPADYIFVDVKVEDKRVSISRGSKISHALRRHHREARKNRARIHLAAHCASNNEIDDQRQREQTASIPDSFARQIHSHRMPPHEQQMEQRASPVQILPPSALKQAFGQGRLDPFNVYPVENISLYVHEILDHAVNHKWPSVSPFSKLSANPVRQAWLGCAMANAVAFYAFVFAAGLHHAYRHGWENVHSRAYDLLFSYKTKAIGLINKALQKPDVDISDALLVSILVLAAHGPRATNSRDDPEEERILSPLADTQNMDFYGSLEFDGLHMQALRVLIARRGGLQTIALYSLAETIAFGEILGASENLAQPFFPECFSCPSTIIPVHKPPLPVNFFSSLHKQVAFQELLLVLHDMSAICAALNAIQTGASEPSLFHDLIRTRNTVQHRLLSLPHRNSILSPDHAIYEACRLSAMIFSDIVTFPLPASANVRSRLSSILRQTLEQVQTSTEKSIHGQVLLWVLVLGAIAAAKVESDRNWFYASLKQDSELLGINTWVELQAVMKKSLWFDTVCDPLARRVWANAINLG